MALFWSLRRVNGRLDGLGVTGLISLRSGRYCRAMGWPLSPAQPTGSHGKGLMEGYNAKLRGRPSGRIRDGSIEILSSAIFRCGDTRRSISSSTDCCSETQDLPNQSLRLSLPRAWQLLSGTSDYPVRDHRRRRDPLVHLHLMVETLTSNACPIRS
jgi:hypothetical protein